MISVLRTWFGGATISAALFQTRSSWKRHELTQKPPFAQSRAIPHHVTELSQLLPSLLHADVRSSRAMRTTAMESVYFALMLTFVVTKCQSQLLHLPGYHYNPQVIKLPVLLVVCGGTVCTC